MFDWSIPEVRFGIFSLVLAFVAIGLVVVDFSAADFHYG